MDFSNTLKEYSLGRLIIQAENLSQLKMTYITM